MVVEGVMVLLCSVVYVKGREVGVMVYIKDSVGVLEWVLYVMVPTCIAYSVLPYRAILAYC